MTTPRKLKFRPYARLLTMLGDQLIKNERIALVEVIKNAYDADASWVKVTFEGFSPDFVPTSDSRIIIEDDGVGMTTDVIENHWVNPATPLKWIGKQTKPKTAKGRVIQGEKGIGRFALLKLGKRIVVTTRPKRSKAESTLTLDVSGFDENFISKEQGALFLDDISLRLVQTDPAVVIRQKKVPLGARKIDRARHGTRITISHLTSTWSRPKVEKVFEDLTRLQTIFNFGETEAASNDAFEVAIYRDKEFEPLSSERREKLDALLEQNAVLKIENGRYDEIAHSFFFDINGRGTTLSLFDPDIAGLAMFRKHFGKGGSVISERGTQCGSFAFEFFVFDFSNDAKGKFHLDGDDKKLVKDHRIYLYRDGIRVYPYGDPEDDWLQIDVYRGTIRTSEFLSNDQVVGYVNITQESNPDLRDKTSREGLIDTGYATDDFRVLLQSILAWVRKGPYERYRYSLRQSHEVAIYKNAQVQAALNEAVAAAAGVPEIKVQLDEANKLYKAERKYLVQRAETTEHLAGVGLSVETASHDLMLAMQRALGMIDSLIVQTQRPGAINKELINRDLSTVRGTMSFMEKQMKDVQLLFKSSKQRKRDLRVVEQLAKVERLFQGPLDRANIAVEVRQVGSPLVAKTTEAVLLQLFLNLFDNSLYWLEGFHGDRKIVVELDGSNGTMTFADNGPGFKPEDLPYVFEPFFSGKGEEGRGLGLYIARQLLERHDYTIDVADKNQALLSGANLVVFFIPESA